MSASSATQARLLVTADDFGRDVVCTEAIARHLVAGNITATSIMANAAEFDRACRLAHSHGLDGKIGVHLVLDEGPPLSPQMRAFADASGNLCVRRSLKPLGVAMTQAVEAELTAQIERVIAAGIRPTHLDSHRHIHTVFPVGRVVVRLARRFGIRYVRPARTLGVRRRATSMAYKWLFNRFVASQVPTAACFGDIVDLWRNGGSEPVPGLTEVMVHLDDGEKSREGRELLDNPRFHELVRKRYRVVDHAGREG